MNIAGEMGSLRQRRKQRVCGSQPASLFRLRIQVRAIRTDWSYSSPFNRQPEQLRTTRCPLLDGRVVGSGCCGLGKHTPWPNHQPVRALRIGRDWTPASRSSVTSMRRTVPDSTATTLPLWRNQTTLRLSATPSTTTRAIVSACLGWLFLRHGGRHCPPFFYTFGSRFYIFESRVVVA